MSEMIYAGFSRVDITPEAYVCLSGFGTDSRRLTDTVLDHVTASVLALSDSEDNTVILCTADLLNAKFETVVQTARDHIGKATGVAPERISIGVVHTHSAPATYSREDEDTDIYLDYFGVQLAKAAAEAMADRKPAKILIGRHRAENMTFVRHYKMNDGTLAGACFGSFKSGAKEHLFPADDQMQLIRFVREDARDIVIMNWQCHSTFIGHPEGKILSADYASPLRDHVEGLTGCHFAFFQGAAGNQVPRSRIPERNVVEDDYIAYGRRLAEEVVEGLQDMQPVSGGKVDSRQRIYHGEVDHSYDHMVPVAKMVQEGYSKLGPGQERYDLVHGNGFNSIYHANQVINRSRHGAYIDMEIDAFRVGDISFVTAPYEMFASNGKYVKENTPFAMTFVMAYCNGSYSYIPDAAGFTYDCYEHNSCHFYPGTGEKITENHLEMLREMQEQ